MVASTPQQDETRKRHAVLKATYRAVDILVVNYKGGYCNYGCILGVSKSSFECSDQWGIYFPSLANSCDANSKYISAIYYNDIQTFLH